MQISLTPEMEELVKTKVSSGRYGSTGEVVSQALLLLNETELLEKGRLEVLRQEIEKGVQSGEKDGWIEAADVFQRLEERFGKDPR